ncbi:efflux RND transporter permease subunit [Roseiconus nitratireducens]|uniref:Efflux RND transporter permease subunit n=2 Tax=Roseiconus nitratireducens TaxID=2605748 RepID=A0A5M6DDG4_9BACT|nr:efflux RND transporter permease subunit [Roseiconus nitratireducens]
MRQSAQEQSSTGRSQSTDFTTLFYRNPRLLLLVVGIVVVGGLTSFAVLPRMEDPVIAKRTGLVSTRLPGADAERVEILVTEPLEEHLQEMEELKKLTSESRPGISTVIVELRDDVMETDEAWSEVRGKINDAIAELPVDASRPAFEEIDARAYAMIVAICWQRPTPPNWTVLRRLAKQLEDQMRGIDGTEVIDRFADPGEQITVELDPERAAALSLSASDVAQAMRGSDAKNAAGLLHSGQNDVVIELANQFQEPGRIGETLIRAGRGGEMIRLDDVATIDRGVPAPLPRLGTIDGSPAVSLGILVRADKRVDLWRPDAQAVLESFREVLPAGVGLDVPLDQSHYVVARLSSLALNLVIGAICVILVVLLLMGWRSAIVVAMSLPLSILGVLFGLRILGVPIHQMSVSGMIVALGLLIDNAIVAVDEVAGALRQGRSPLQAVRDMVRHLAIPLLGSTVTTALAFAPIAMMPGNAGEFVGAIAISVILAITSSLFFSLTIIPVVAAWFLKPDSEKRVTELSDGPFELEDSRAGWLENGIGSRRMASTFRSVLTWLLEKPYRGVFIGLTLPVFGFAIANRLPEQFFPPAQRDQFHIQLELPIDSSIKATRQAARRLTDLVRDVGAVKVSWYFGESAPMFYYNVLDNRRGVPNFANAIVQMPTSEGIGEILRNLQRRADRVVPGARVLCRQLEQGPPYEAPIELRLFGPDLNRLVELGEQLRLALAAAPNVIHTRSLLAETLPTIRYDVRDADARLAGLEPADVSEQLYAMLEGVSAGSVLEDTELVPVLVRIGDQRRSRLGELQSLQLHSGSRKIPLQSVADVSLHPEIAVIPRMNRRRMNLISGFVTAGSLPSLSLKAFEERLAATGFDLPPGYHLEYGGEDSQRNDAVGNLLANAGVLAVLMVAVLVLSFRSFRLAGVIFVVAVCSGGLGMIALWLGGYPFGFMAIIGIMGLIGVAINDSIVVLASLQQASSQGSTTVGDLVQTVMDCTRHVLATTLTTVAGFTPLILDGGEFWPPLAVAIAGGVTGATLLALSFVPAAYRWLVLPRETAAAEGSSTASLREPERRNTGVHLATDT